MKLIVGALASLGSIASLPLLAVPGSGHLAHDPYSCGNIAVILDTIRTLESGGNYQAKAPGSTASGAYQYIDATWQTWARRTLGPAAIRYPTARSAPVGIQDQVAAANVADILEQHDNNVAVVPLIWYLPAALDDPDLIDRVPAGNTLTPRQYQTRWLTTYHRKLDTQQGPVAAAACNPTSPDGMWALPVHRDLLTPATIRASHHDYPAWDLMLPTGTPIHAITGGNVVSTQYWDGNWWADGCTGHNPPTGCNTCGNGITIETVDRLRHTYCHNSRLHATLGDQIAPGQHVADSGDTGRSGGPHLHLELRLDGTRHCPQPLIAALYNNQPAPAANTLPTSGCSF
jgi:hypothetical protein